LFITLNENGRYLASHGSPEGVVHTGDFMLKNNLLIFMDGWDCSPLPNDTPGSYIPDLRNAGKWMYFKLAEDACLDRAGALGTFRWSRHVRTP
jgi:hypothetical protein